MTNFQSVDQKLKSLGWDWGHPRIKVYISDLNQIKNATYSPSTLPGKHYAKILAFAETYKNIDRFLISQNKDWSEPLILNFFAMNSTRDKKGNSTNRLKLSKWLELNDLVVEFFCPF